MRKPERTIVFCFGALLVVAGVLVAQQEAEPPQPAAPAIPPNEWGIVVSKETTHWTEPLRDDGLPDYRKLILDAQSEGVTPENNGAALYWRVFWPGGWRNESAEHQRMFLDMLDMEAPAGEPLENIRGAQVRARIQTWIDEQRPGVDALDAISIASGQPWKAQDLPPLGDWIAENRAKFDLLAQMGEKPAIFNPPRFLLTAPSGSALTTAFDSDPILLNSFFTLRARAFLRMGSGDPQAAWRDLHACFHIIHRSPRRFVGLANVLPRYAAHQVAVDGVVHLLAQPDLPAPLVRGLFDDISQLQEFDLMIDCLDHPERMIALETALVVPRADEDLEEMIEVFGVEVHEIPQTADQWNEALKDLNRWRDEITQAARIQDREERKEAFDALYARLPKWSPFGDESDDEAAAPLGPPISSHLLAERIVAVLSGNEHSALVREDQTNTQLNLLKVAAGLAVLKSERGEYPAALAPLKEALFEELPVDAYRGAPLVYRRTEDGYLLYSTGMNGVDDNGRYGRGADDVSIQSPPSTEPWPRARL